MPAASARGHQAQVGMSTGVAFGGANSAISFPIQARSESVKKILTHVETGGITGNIDHIADDVVDGPYRVSGSLLIVPKPTMLDGLSDKILSGTTTGIDPLVYAPGQALKEWHLQIDRKTKVFAYEGCVAGRCRFFSSKGNPLLLEMQVEGRKSGAYSGTTFTEGSPGAAGSFPALTLETAQPYMHHQGVFTIGGTAYEFDNIEVVIDNVLDTERFNNSQTRTEIPLTDRIISVTATFPYSTDEVNLLEVATAGVAGTLKYTRGNRSLLFTFGKLQKPDDHPVMEGPTSEISQTITFMARKIAGTGAGLATGATDALTITNDKTA